MTKQLERLHRALGRSPAAVRLAVLVRNQACAVISQHLGADYNPQTNGEAWLVSQIAPTASTFIDVGANVGDWSGMFLKSITLPPRAMLFDPSEVVMKTLRGRFAGNVGVQLVQAAVSDTIGQMPFYEEPGPRGTATSSLVACNSNPAAVEKLVRVTTLDSEVERAWGDTHIDFLKIDAEGYDLHALRGASRLLRRQQVGIVQFEYNTTWIAAGSTLLDALNFLGTNGYQTFLLKRDGLFALDYQRYGEYFSYSNLVAVSPAARSRVTPPLRSEK